MSWTDYPALGERAQDRAGELPRPVRFFEQRQRG